MNFNNMQCEYCSRMFNDKRHYHDHLDCHMEILKMNSVINKLFDENKTIRDIISVCTCSSNKAKFCIDQFDFDILLLTKKDFIENISLFVDFDKTKDDKYTVYIKTDEYKNIDLVDFNTENYNKILK